MPARRATARWEHAVLAIVTLGALGAGAVALVQADRAKDARKRERIATSRYAAEAAVARAETNPELAMLVALEAYRIVEGLPVEAGGEARRALLTTARRSARLLAVLRGHRGEVTHVEVFSRRPNHCDRRCRPHDQALGRTTTGSAPCAARAKRDRRARLRSHTRDPRIQWRWLDLAAAIAVGGAIGHAVASR